MKPKPIVAALAFASLFFAIVLPPEAYPDGKMAILLCASFAFFVSVAERRIDRRYLTWGIVVFALLVIHSLVLSVDAYRSIEFVTTLWTYYCLAGFFLYAGFDPILPLTVSMVGLSIIVSSYGLYQYFWGFETLSRYISHSGSDEVIKGPALEIVKAHRVYSTLALPGTLWGFLVMAIPFHAVLWRKNLAVKVIVSVSFAMLLVTGFLTRSFGFLVGLLLITVVWLFLHHRRMLWNKLSIVLFVLAASGGAFYSARRVVIAGANPVVLRFANWISAWSVFSMNPWGSGLNTFGIVYPRYMLSGANETQYTHNTALQLTSELGYFAVAAGIVLILLAVKKWPQLARIPIAERECVLLALTVWVLHNLIDIDVYFASVGAVGAVLIGVFLRDSEARTAPPGKGLIAGFAVISMTVVLFSGLVLFSTELQNRAQVEYDSLKPKEALETLREARRLMPFNSSIYHDAGQIQLELSQKLHEPQHLAEAKESFSRAIELSPYKVGPHIGLGLCLSAEHDVVGGLKEIRVAQFLYPDNTYAQAVVRLMEKSLATP